MPKLHPARRRTGDTDPYPLLSLKCIRDHPGRGREPAFSLFFGGSRFQPQETSFMGIRSQGWNLFPAILPGSEKVSASESFCVERDVKLLFCHSSRNYLYRWRSAPTAAEGGRDPELELTALSSGFSEAAGNQRGNANTGPRARESTAASTSLRICYPGLHIKIPLPQNPLG